MPKSTKPHAPRNTEIAKGISRFGRRAAFHRKGKWALKKKNAVFAKPQAKPAALKSVKFGKKGATRTVHLKPRSWYNTEDISKPLQTKSKKVSAQLDGLKAGIKPGSVLILLAGKHMGKRVVYLKRLASGQLLVTGPYKSNGVPLKRVYQSYVIATSTSVDISGVKVDDKINDEWFKKTKKEKTKKTEGEFFAKEQKKKELAPERKEMQKAVDSQLLPLIKKVQYLGDYMGSRFSLSKGQYPHLMKF